MTMVYMGAAIAALGAVLFFVARAYSGKCREIAEKNGLIAEQELAMQKRDKYLAELEGIRNETESKKGALRTGDPGVDFDNSIGVLDGLTGGKKPPAEP
jgi:hypothetical protein